MENNYSECEKQFVIENYNRMTKKEIGQAIGRSESSVKTFGKRNGLSGASSVKWSDKEIDFLKNNYKSKTHNEMAVELNRGEKAVRSKCAKLGLYKLDLSWSNSDTDFLMKNYKKMTAREIAISLGCKVSTIRNKAFEMRLLKDRYTIDRDFFKAVNTEEKAYWLGFLYADGCVRKIKGKSFLQLGLAERDVEHLVKLKNSLGSNTPLMNSKDGVPRLTINCTELAEDLILLGCVPRKTYVELSIPSQIPQNLKRHFIRGYVDGDGWIVNATYGGFKKYGIGLVSHKKNILMEIIKDFEHLDLQCKNKTIHKSNSDNTYKFEYGAKADVYKILNYLYNDSTIYLDRKHQKAQQTMQDVAPHQIP